MTTFTKLQEVRAKATVQGLLAGDTYTVQDVAVQHTPFGSFVTYTVQHSVLGGALLAIANGHLGLEALATPAPAPDIYGLRTQKQIREAKRRAKANAEAHTAWIASRDKLVAELLALCPTLNRAKVEAHASVNGLSCLYEYRYALQNVTAVTVLLS